MSERKWIEILVHGHYLIITGQSHRQLRFGEGKDSSGFLASNGIRLQSVDSPEWRRGEKRLFVRGGQSASDDYELFIEPIDMVIDAIDEYNVYFGSPEKCYRYYNLPEELFKI
jgi:hypothetical protein